MIFYTRCQTKGLAPPQEIHLRESRLQGKKRSTQKIILSMWATKTNLDLHTAHIFRRSTNSFHFKSCKIRKVRYDWPLWHSVCGCIPLRPRSGTKRPPLSTVYPIGPWFWVSLMSPTPHPPREEGKIWWVSLKIIVPVYYSPEPLWWRSKKCLWILPYGNKVNAQGLKVSLKVSWQLSQGLIYPLPRQETTQPQLKRNTLNIWSIHVYLGCSHLLLGTESLDDIQYKKTCRCCSFHTLFLFHKNTHLLCIMVRSTFYLSNCCTFYVCWSTHICWLMPAKTHK